MKLSLKAREEQRPLFRAKLPLNVLGLPVLTGITSGDPRELAFHLGTNLRAGPLFRVSYKPYNVFSPFSVIVKTGFGLWGSPNGAALAMSAEVNLNPGASPSFSIHLKPKLGDFGFHKHSGSFKASYDAVERSTSADEITMGSGEAAKSVEVNRVENGLQAIVNPHAFVSPQGATFANGDHLGTNSSGVGTGSGSFVMEKVKSFSSGNTPEKSESLKRKRDFTDYAKRVGERTSHSEDTFDEQVAESEDVSTVGEESSSVQRTSWYSVCAKGWRYHTHSSLPLGKWAAARVRWHLNFGSNLFHDLKHGFHISDIKLPTLTVDKVSFEVPKSRRSSSDLSALEFGSGGDESAQLGEIAAMCSSMRYQLQLLHLDNKLLERTIDDLGADVGTRRPGAKGTELMIQEESALRSQMFDELNKKLNGGSSSSSKSRSAPLPSSGKGTTSTGEDFTISANPPEGL